MPDYYFENQDKKKSTELGIMFEAYPSIKAGQQQKDAVTIPGRGTLMINTGTYSDTVITLNFAVTYEGKAAGNIANMCMDAIAYIMDMQEVSFCDSSDYYYMVKNAEISDITQYSDVSAEMTVTLTCEPGAYLFSGKEPRQVASAREEIDNLYSTSQPVYTITGEGVCTLKVNGHSVMANVAQNLTIDTYRMTAYKDAGELQNTAISGEYEDLYFRHGTNVVEITDGFKLTIIPRWRRL